MSFRDDASEGCQQPCQQKPMCPLSLVRLGASVRIKRLPESSDLTNRLREIGFCEEQVIRLIARQATFICQVCNARLAISARLAEFILVEPVESPAVG